jgi:hypothetical protein
VFEAVDAVDSFGRSVDGPKQSIGDTLAVCEPVAAPRTPLFGKPTFQISPMESFGRNDEFDRLSGTNSPVQ